MSSNPLLDILKSLAKKERKIKEFKRRLRVKGKVVASGLTKKGNITLIVRRDDDDFKFTVIKSHKDRFALARNLKPRESISIAGIPRFRMIICTQLKKIEKGLPEGKQAKLGEYG